MYLVSLHGHGHVLLAGLQRRADRVQAGHERLLDAVLGEQRQRLGCRAGS